MRRCLDEDFSLFRTNLRSRIRDTVRLPEGINADALTVYSDYVINGTEPRSSGWDLTSGGITEGDDYASSSWIESFCLFSDDADLPDGWDCVNVTVAGPYMGDPREEAQTATTGIKGISEKGAMGGKFSFIDIIFTALSSFLLCVFTIFRIGVAFNLRIHITSNQGNQMVLHHE